MKKIEVLLKVPMALQRLYYQGKVLYAYSDEAKVGGDETEACGETQNRREMLLVADYDVHHESTIHLSLGINHDE
jgi:hypothetical protein